MTQLIPRIEYPEIVIGLVAPIGTSLEDTISETRKFFRSVGYEVHELRVTDVFKRLTKLFLNRGCFKLRFLSDTKAILHMAINLGVLLTIHL